MKALRSVILVLTSVLATTTLLAIMQEDVQPTRETILLQAARNAASVDNPKLAVERFWEYLALKPADGQAALELAGLLARLDRRKEAEKLCVAVVAKLTQRHEIDPHDVDVLRQLSLLTRWLMRYDESAHWYELYLERRPNDKEARLEQARLAGWDLRYADANRHYEALANDFPDELRFKLEGQAKHHNWLGRPRKASQYYRRAMELSPDDVELLFDLGQMYSRRNLSRRAERQYDRVLEHAPSHSMAARAKQAERWRRKSHVRVKQSYLHKGGRGREVDITQFRTDVKYAPQRLSEGLDLSIGVGQSFFSFDLKPQIDQAPTRLERLLSTAKLPQAALVVGFMNQLGDRRRLRRFDSRSPATHLMLGFDRQSDTGARTWLDVELTAYDQRPHQTIQFDTGISYRLDDVFEIAVIGGLEDILENFVTLDDGLSRYYIGARFDWQPIKHAGLLGEAKGYWYDDHNTAIDYNVQAYTMLSTYPQILKLVAKVYGFHVGGERFDYWTPRDYWHSQVGLSWHHYLNDWHFEGSERFYYYLEAFAGLDNNGEPSVQGKAGLVWDSQHRWKMGVEVSASDSDVYEEQRGTVYFQYAW